MSLWYFEDTDLYNMFCPHNVEGMKENHVFQSFKKDDYIYFSDEKSSHIYLIQSGQIKIGTYTEDGKEVVKDMQELMKEDKEFSFKIFRILGLRLVKAERKIESLINKDARTRIVEYLIDLAEERGQKVGDETLVKHFFKHKDIASLTATSRQTVTTVLNELREKNVINFDRKRLLIRDLGMMRNIKLI